MMDPGAREEQVRPANEIFTLLSEGHGLAVIPATTSPRSATAGPDPGTARPDADPQATRRRDRAAHAAAAEDAGRDANVKLTRVVTDILGASGRAILAALIAGETDPERLADCTDVRLKASRADIVAAVHGRVTAHHRFLLQLHLTQIDALRAAVENVWSGRLTRCCSLFARRPTG